MMFEIPFHIAFIGPGGPEFLVVMLVLLVMFGAKDAPRIFRKINEMINSVRNTADGFKREIMYGDINDEPVSADDGYEDYEDPFEEEDLDNEDYLAEAERDYSDETFQHLEEDLEHKNEEVASDAAPADGVSAAEPRDDGEVDDVPKA